LPFLANWQFAPLRSTSINNYYIFTTLLREEPSVISNQ
jgi:hypothetical protein